MKTHLIDVSHWNGNINWAVAKDHAPAIAKATEGVTFVDSEFADNKTGLQHYQRPWGNYHFFRPAYNPIEQAVHNVATVGSGCFVYAVDVETPLLEQIKATREVTFSGSLNGRETWNLDTTTRVQALINNELNNCLSRIPGSRLEHATLATLVDLYISALIDRVPNVRVLFYSSPYFWKTFMKLPDGSYPNWNDRARLWEAHYYVENPAPMPPWNPCLIHQYTDRLSVPGIVGNVDGDWFYGTETERDDYFGNGVSTPTPPHVPDKVYVNVNTLRIRNEPTDRAGDLTVIGTTTRDKVWYPQDAVVDEQDRVWWKVGRRVYLAAWLTRE